MVGAAGRVVGLEPGKQQDVAMSAERVPSDGATGGLGGLPGTASAGGGGGSGGSGASGCTGSSCSGTPGGAGVLGTGGNGGGGGGPNCFPDLSPDQCSSLSGGAGGGGGAGRFGGGGGGGGGGGAFTGANTGAGAGGGGGAGGSSLAPTGGSVSIDTGGQPEVVISYAVPPAGGGGGPSNVCRVVGAPSTTQTVGVKGVFHVTAFTCGDAQATGFQQCPHETIAVPDVTHTTVYYCLPPGVTFGGNGLNQSVTVGGVGGASAGTG